MPRPAAPLPIRLFLAGLLALAVLAAHAQARFDFDATPGRLAKTVRPTHQAVTLTLDPAGDRFDGEVTIALDVRRPVEAIVLHAHSLQAGPAALLAAGGERALQVQPDAATQTWRLVPTDGALVPAGVQRLRIAYAGRVQRNDSGLYRAEHRVDGQAQRMLATQMEAVFARSVFPAFDEPSFRTVFEMTVRAPAGLDVVANMPEVAVDGEGGWRRHRFAPTPPMPAYLVAVAVGRFDALPGRAGRVPLRVLTAPGRRELARHALDTTERVLPWYESYFGVPYAVPKLDQLAVPGGARQGAMEDWGLISYAEDLLLFDPAASDAMTRRRIFSVVAHEVAHQWFGNLVTAASWEEIWLNEAFATWLAEKATQRFNPQWQVPLRRRGEIDETMARDAGPSTRAIRSGAVAEDRVFDVFDKITYTKGGAVLSMLEQWIGAPVFRRGIAAYIRERRLSNATAGDLWFHIGRAAGRDVAAVAASWTDQPGFPLLEVASRCEAGRTRVTLAQQRFVHEGTPGPARWKVPVQLLRGARATTVLLEGDRQSVELPGCTDAPVLVNGSGQGFYRVAYAPPLNAALVRRFAHLPPAAAVTLMSDTFALAQAGRLPMSAWLEVLAALPSAHGPGVPALWSTARQGLHELDLARAGTPAQPALHAAARALLAPQLARLGWSARDGEDSETQVLRGDLIDDLARYDDPAVIARARALFDADERGEARLPATLRASVVRAVARHADGARFGRLVARLRRASTDEDRRLHAEALAEVRDPALAAQVLALALDGSLPPPLAARIPGMVGHEPRHAAAAYTYAVAHWPALSDLAGEMFGARVRILPESARGFHAREQARRLAEDQQRLAGAPGAAMAAEVAAAITLAAQVREREAGRIAPALRALERRMRPGGRARG